MAVAPLEFFSVQSNLTNVLVGYSDLNSEMISTKLLISAHLRCCRFYES